MRFARGDSRWEARRFYQTKGFAFALTVAVLFVTNLLGRHFDVALFPFVIFTGIVVGVMVGIEEGLVGLGLCLVALFVFWHRPEWMPRSGQATVNARIVSGLAGILLAGGVVIHVDRFKRRAMRQLDRARELANLDALTGVSNRRHGQQLLVQELSRAARRGRALSILLFDIDHFKRINDSLGHQLGDAVLKELVGVVRQQLRTYDQLARWGGEEFLVILPETAGAEASGVAERLRLAVARHRFPGEAPLTISVGVASFEAGDDAESLFGRADELLLKAKSQGRNMTLV